MSDLLVRNLDPKILKRLKAIAQRHHRSLQSEIKAILTEVVPFLTKEAVSVSSQWRRQINGRKLTDSADLIREDRNR